MLSSTLSHPPNQLLKHDTTLITALKPVLVKQIKPTETVSLVRIVLLDRDYDACPAPLAVEKDKILGTSRVIGETELFSGQKNMTFVVLGGSATVTLTYNK